MEGKNHFRGVWTQTPLFSGGNIVSVALPSTQLNFASSDNTAIEEANNMEMATAKVANQLVKCVNKRQELHTLEKTITMEGLVMVCGDVVNLVAASTGVLLCSYKLPVEDVILHLDAVSHLHTGNDANEINSENVTEEEQKQQIIIKTEAEDENKNDCKNMNGNVQSNTLNNNESSKSQCKKRSRKRKRDSLHAENVTSSDNRQENCNHNNNNKITVNGAEDKTLDVPLGIYVAVATRSLQIYLLRVDVVSNDMSESDTEAANTTSEHETNRTTTTTINTPANKQNKFSSNTTFAFHLLRNWTAAQQAISMVYFSPHSNFLVSASTDGNVKVWNPFHHYLTHNLYHTHASVITSVVLNTSETLLAVGDVEGYVTVFDFVNKKTRATCRPHVQTVAGLYITNIHASDNYHVSPSTNKANQGLFVYSVSHDRKLAILQLSHNLSTLREVRGIVLREHVTACCFENESTLHVGALDGAVITYSIHPTLPIQLVCKFEPLVHESIHESDTEASVRSLLVSSQYKGYYRQIGGFIADPPAASKSNKSALYVADAGFNIACLRKRQISIVAQTSSKLNTSSLLSSSSSTTEEETADNNITNNSGGSVMESHNNTFVNQVNKLVYEVAYTLVGYFGQILDLKMLPRIPNSHFNLKNTTSTMPAMQSHINKEDKCSHQCNTCTLHQVTSLNSLQRLIVTNSKDVRLFPSMGCRSTHCLQGHTDIVMCCAVSHDGMLIATAGKDTTVRFWCRFPVTSASSIHQANWNKKSQATLSSSTNTTITAKESASNHSETQAVRKALTSNSQNECEEEYYEEYELEEEMEEEWQWRCVAVGTQGHTNDINALVFNCKFSHSFCLLFSVGNDENLRLWDVDQEVLPWTYNYYNKDDNNNDNISMSTNASRMKESLESELSSKTKSKLKSNVKNSRSKRTNTDVSAEMESLSLPHVITHRAGVNSAHTGPIYTVAVSPNDQYVATGGKDKKVHLWNITGKKIYREGALTGHKRGVASLAFSSHDRVLASASHDGSIRLWSLTSLLCVKTLQMDKTAILQMAFFNQGTQLVCGNSEGVIRVWAIATSQEVWSGAVHEDKIWSLQVVEVQDVNDKNSHTHHINAKVNDDDTNDGSNGGDITTTSSNSAEGEHAHTMVQTFVLSGSADGVLHCMEDYTAEAIESAKAERAEMVQQEQALQNALRSNGFVQAFQLALKLRHPRHLRQVLVKWCTRDSNECTHSLQEQLLPHLDQDELTQLLQFTREWLTNSRYCHIAAVVIHAVVSIYSLTEITHMSHLHSLIAPLLAYSQKHSQRQHELLRQTYYIDYLARALNPTTLTKLPPFVKLDNDVNTNANMTNTNAKNLFETSINNNNSKHE